MRLLRYLLLAGFSLFLAACGYNTLQAQDEAVSAAWSEVLNQYQRRADLVPNLVNVVKGYAAHEKDVLVAVTDARASVGSVKADASLLNDPAAFARFEQAQAQMSSSLARLLVVSENYPTLRATENFQELQAQLEGTENRIAVERGKFNDTVQQYDTAIRRFPAVIIAGIFKFTDRPYFTAAPGAETAPKVQFDFSGKNS